jgi:hypothetical protein
VNYDNSSDYIAAQEKEAKLLASLKEAEDRVAQLEKLLEEKKNDL